MGAPVRVGRARMKALDIIGRLGPVEPLVFAKAMWPRARAWGEPTIMAWSGRTVLEKLKKDGLVAKTEFGFMLNAAGLQLRDELFPLAD